MSHVTTKQQFIEYLDRAIVLHHWNLPIPFHILSDKISYIFATLHLKLHSFEFYVLSRIWDDLSSHIEGCIGNDDIDSFHVFLDLLIAAPSECFEHASFNEYWGDLFIQTLLITVSESINFN